MQNLEEMGEVAADTRAEKRISETGPAPKSPLLEFESIIHAHHSALSR